MRKFTESLSSIKKVEPKTISYYSIMPLLEGLESERPGIKDRVWNWLCNVPYDSPQRNKVFFLNLFFYGIGDEYKIDLNELENSKRTWPKAFEEGTFEKELRLDLNLIIYVYQDELGDDLDMKVMWE